MRMLKLSYLYILTGCGLLLFYIVSNINFKSSNANKDEANSVIINSVDKIASSSPSPPLTDSIVKDPVLDASKIKGSPSKLIDGRTIISFDLTVDELRQITTIYEDTRIKLIPLQIAHRTLIQSDADEATTILKITEFTSEGKSIESDFDLSIRQVLGEKRSAGFIRAMRMKNDNEFLNFGQSDIWIKILQLNKEISVQVSGGRGQVKYSNLKDIPKGLQHFVKLE